MVVRASDSFTGSNGTGITSYSSDWEYTTSGASGTDIQIQNNGYTGNDTGSDIVARNVSETFIANQYSRAVLQTNTSPGTNTNATGVAVRCGSSGSSSYMATYVASDGDWWEFFDDDFANQYGNVTSGQSISLTEGTTTVELVALGQLFFPLKDGITPEYDQAGDREFGVIHTGHTSGNPGIVVWDTSGHEMIFDNWDGGTLQVATVDTSNGQITNEWDSGNQASIDEAETAIVTSEYLQISNPNGEVCEFLFNSLSDPADHDNHYVVFVINFVSGGRTYTLQSELYQGTTQIGTRSITNFDGNDSGVNQVLGWRLTTSEAGNITDYGDLRQRLTVTQTGGGSGSTLRLVWMGFATPEAAAGGTDFTRTVAAPTAALKTVDLTRTVDNPTAALLTADLTRTVASPTVTLLSVLTRTVDNPTVALFEADIIRTVSAPTVALLQTDLTRTVASPTVALTHTRTVASPTAALKSTDLTRTVASPTASLTDELIVSNPSVSSLGTVGSADNLAPDGYTWPINSPMQVDQYGNILIQLQDNSGNKNIDFLYSNNAGSSWSTTNLGEAGYLRCSYVIVGSVIHAIFKGNQFDAAGDIEIVYRRYNISYDGSNNITGIAVDTNIDLQLDADAGSTTEFWKPNIIYESSTHSILLMWVAEESGTGCELRASMRALSDDSNDNTAANWTFPVTDDTNSVADAPNVDFSIIASTTDICDFSAILKTQNTNAGDIYVFYHDDGDWSYRRMRWNGSSKWSTGLTTPQTVSALVRAGTDNGYDQKRETGSKPVEDVGNDRVYWAFGNYKDDSSTGQDTFSFVWIPSSDTPSSIVDVYSFGNNTDASKWNNGDLAYDQYGDWLVIAYPGSGTRSYYVQVYQGSTQVQVETEVWDATGDAVDIPLLGNGRYNDSGTYRLLVLLRNETDPSPSNWNPPFQGYFGTLDWAPATITDLTVTVAAPTVALKSVDLTRTVASPTVALKTVDIAHTVTATASLSEPASDVTRTVASPTVALLSVLTRTISAPTVALFGTDNTVTVASPTVALFEADLTVTVAAPTVALKTVDIAHTVPADAALIENDLTRTVAAPTAALLSVLTRTVSAPTVALEQFDITRTVAAPTAALLTLDLTRTVSAPTVTLTASLQRTVANPTVALLSVDLARTISSPTTALLTADLTRTVSAPTVALLQELTRTISAPTVALFSTDLTRTSSSPTVALKTVDLTRTVASPTANLSADVRNLSVGVGYSDISNQQVIRTSADRVYVFATNCDSYPNCSTNGLDQTLRAYKANATGIPQSFARQDSSNEVGGVFSWGAAIDSSDVIHIIVAARQSGGNIDIKYVTYATSTDTWGTPENIAAAANTTEVGQGDEQVSISLDSSDLPHVVYLDDDGTRNRVRYNNRSGGTWGNEEDADDGISYGTNERGWSPTIINLSDDQVFVGFGIGTFNDQNDTTFYTRRRTTGGTWQSEVSMIANVATGIDNGIRLITTSNDRIHVALGGSKNGSGDMDPKYFYSDNDGVSFNNNHPTGNVGHNVGLGPGVGTDIRIYQHGTEVTDDNNQYMNQFDGSSWDGWTSYAVGDFDSSLSTRWQQFNHVSAQYLDTIYWDQDYPNDLYYGLSIVSVPDQTRTVASPTVALQSVDLTRTIASPTVALITVDLTETVASPTVALQSIDLTRTVSAPTTALFVTDVTRTIASPTVALQNLDLTRTVSAPTVALLTVDLTRTISAPTVTLTSSLQRVVASPTVALLSVDLTRTVVAPTVALLTVDLTRTISAPTVAFVQTFTRTIAAPTVALLTTDQQRIVAAPTVTLAATDLTRTISAPSAALFQADLTRTVSAPTTALLTADLIRTISAPTVALLQTFTRVISAPTVNLIDYFTLTRTISAPTVALRGDFSRTIPATISLLELGLPSVIEFLEVIEEVKISIRLEFP